MLVLSRKQNEAFYIGEHTIVRVLEFGDNQVKISIDSPQDGGMLRQEILNVEDKLRIDEDVSLKLHKVWQSRVKFGIYAPRSIPVFREEIMASRANKAISCDSPCEQE